jgi:hypothetical protein
VILSCLLAVTTAVCMLAAAFVAAYVHA